MKGNPIIGIAALGSSIIHIHDRDKWIGWDTKTRTNRIIYMMDAYIVGAMPPYNYLLGGKLISYILASNELRAIYKEKYANAKTIIDGWLHTGDVGIMDEDGYITIVDRTKDMLIVSGFKVYSVHVEDILTKHPNVELVAIIGLKDPDRPGSEIVKAVVQLKESVEPTEKVKEDLKSYAVEHLSKYENPKRWEFIETMPLTAVGKVLKRALREDTNK